MPVGQLKLSGCSADDGRFRHDLNNAEGNCSHKGRERPSCRLTLFVGSSGARWGGEDTSSEEDSGAKGIVPLFPPRLPHLFQNGEFLKKPVKVVRGRLVEEKDPCGVEIPAFGVLSEVQEVLESGGGQNEGIQVDAGISETFLQPLDLLMEHDLGVIPAFGVADAFGVEEDDVLGVTVKEPEDEVRVEVAGFKKADAFPAAVAEDVEFPAIEETPVAVMPLFESFEELPFAFVQSGGSDLHGSAAGSKVEERFVEVAVPGERLHSNAHEPACLQHPWPRPEADR